MTIWYEKKNGLISNVTDIYGFATGPDLDRAFIRACRLTGPGYNLSLQILKYRNWSLIMTVGP